MSQFFLHRLALLTALLCFAPAPLHAQETQPPTGPDVHADTPEAPKPAAPAMFPHSQTSRFYVAGQSNTILQAHGPFHSPYQGPNSLLARGEYKVSLIETLYLGAELLRDPHRHLELLYDEESAGGRGISQALGLAGFTNLDVVRNPTLGSKPYLARFVLHGTLGLSSKITPAERGPFSLATFAPERRFEFRIGKMGLSDVFDTNSIGTDSHLQFLNWTVDNNGAWDYAADTRGYTVAAVAEYDDRSWSFRYGLALMPKIANGIDLDWDLRRASGQNFEFEERHSLIANHAGAARVLGYVNHAHMGLYRQANKAFLAHTDSTPEITKHETFGAVKYGFGLNAEQELPANFRGFLRLGWNEGQHESFAYTEVDSTAEFGGDLVGKRWSRPDDKLGLVFVSNGIKRDHQAYLALGGLGFLLGDGKLNYAREDILEGYYTLHAWRGLYYSLDGQWIHHPGYNRDRGPALVEALRMHMDF